MLLFSTRLIRQTGKFDGDAFCPRGSRPDFCAQDFMIGKNPAQAAYSRAEAIGRPSSWIPEKVESGFRKKIIWTKQNDIRRV